jgi:hypothetical protein
MEVDMIRLLDIPDRRDTHGSSSPKEHRMNSEAKPQVPFWVFPG